MSINLTQFFFGRPLETAAAPHQSISKRVGLAVFASDALSSTAYATQEILLILALAGTAAFAYSIPIALAIALLLAVYTFLVLPALHGAVGIGTTAKLALLLLLIAPLGFLMGMPFPLGIRYLSEKNKGGIPWAWGVNGYFSVISTALATIIAVELGFSWVMILAGAAYTAAGAASLLISKP